MPSDHGSAFCLIGMGRAIGPPTPI